MIPAAFDYVAPETLDAALDALREGGEDAKVLAGGHSLVPLMKLRLAAPSLLVDLRRVPGLAGIESNGGVRWTPNDGFVFSPDLPHVSQACGDEFTVPFARVRALLTREGAANVDALRAERARG